MSYDKNINGLTVKFKDEKSYLHCKLDYIYYCEPLDIALFFLSFIQEERYNRDTCEVESIGPIQYASDIPVMNFGTPNGNNDIVGFALGGGNQSETFPVYIGSHNSYIIGADYGVDGSITWNGSSQTFTTHAPDPPMEFSKVEPPEDPIDNRFDILDL